MCKSIYTFYCYAREDEALERELKKHLRPLERLNHIIGWSDQSILPGAIWEQEIEKHLNDANLILLLISPDFLDSENCRREMEKALQRHRKGDAHVIPIILRPAVWQWTPLFELRVLPKDGKPITQWSDTDEAFLDVVHGIARILVEEGVLSPKEARFLEQSDQPTTSSWPVRPLLTPLQLTHERQKILTILHADYKQRQASSLQGRALIELGLHQRNDFVRASSQLVFPRWPVPEERPLPHGTTIEQAYELATGRLLILGNPGTGKTTLLVELALTLLKRAYQDTNQPVPIILNLSTWASQQLPVQQWLIEYIHRAYAVPPLVSQALLEQQQWLLLLDGLDEAAQEARNTCIKAITTYQTQYLMPLVVCCRLREYEEVGTRLTLPMAVVVQPLEPQQVLAYLKQQGESVSAVHIALRNNPALHELINTPLLLTTVLRAYQGKEPEDLPHMGTKQEQQRKIFACYVEQQLSLQRVHGRIPAEQMQRSLCWLAQCMHQAQLTEWHIEQVSVACLPSIHWRYAYRWLAGLIAGLLGGLVFGLSGALSRGLFFGLICGLSGALFIGLRGALRDNPQNGHSAIQLIETFAWSWGRAGSGLICGLICALTYGLSGALSGALSGGLFGGLSGGLLFGLIFGSPGMSRVMELLRKPNQGFIISGWNGLSIGLIGGSLVELSGTLSGGLSGGLSGALIGGLLLGLIFGLSGMPRATALRRKPNQGIITSGWNGLRIGLLAGPSIGLSIGLLFGLHAGLSVGLSAALSVGLLFGGETYLRHYLLRFLLWCSVGIPYNLVGLLEEAQVSILLQRVGTGYRFIHPLFQGYFTSLDLYASPTSSSHSGGDA